MSDRLNKLNEKQRGAFEEFKRLIEDVRRPDEDDLALCKWIIARNFDPKKAEVMYRKSMSWRRQVGADGLLTEWEPPEVLQKYYAGGTSGFDKDGHPVWFELASFMDFKGLYHSAKKSDLIKMEARSIEYLQPIFKEQSRKYAKRIDQVTVIMDLEKLGMKHLWKPGIDTYSAIMQATEDNYPENLRRCFIINAPKIFPITYKIIKPFLTQETRDKIQVLDKNWKETLLRYIDADQLPVHWGGTKTDPDGNVHCQSKINLGGEVPQSYYMTQQETDLTSFTKMVVNRGSAHHVHQRVSLPNSVIRWEFRTENYDIAFGLYRVKSHVAPSSVPGIEDMEEVLSPHRVNSHVVPEDGAATCTQPGTYVLVFDNSFSWTRNKTLFYRVELLLPEGTDSMNNDLDKAMEAVDLDS